MNGPRIVVYESSDPLVTLRLKKRLPDFNGFAPYLLTGSPSIAFVVKADPDEAAVMFTYNSGAEITITDDGSGAEDKFSELAVQFDALDIAAPGVFYWHLDVTKTGNKDTVGGGFLEVRNV